MSNLPVSLIRSGITAAFTDDPPALVSSSGGSPDCCPSSADPRRNFCFKIAQGGTAWIVFRITSRLRVLIVNRTGAAPASLYRANIRRVRFRSTGRLPALKGARYLTVLGEAGTWAAAYQCAERWQKDQDDR